MSPAPLFCEKCGKALQQDDHFCQECGHPAVATTTVSAPTQPPPCFDNAPPPLTFNPPPPVAPTVLPPSTQPTATTRGSSGKILIGLLTLILLGAAAFFRSSSGQNFWHKLTQGIPAINPPITNTNPQTPVIPPALPDAPPPSPTSSETEAERWLEQGYTKEQTGDLTGAIQDYQKALDLTGKNEIADRIRQLQQTLRQPPPTPPTVQASVLYKTSNIAAVANGATMPNRFSTSKPLLITRIMTYHWNNGRGRAPGLISLEHEDGTQYGPWQAIGENGQGGVPNAGWIVKPDIIIKPGTYNLLDSHPTSWSQNAGTGGKGMCEIQGIPQP